MVTVTFISVQSAVYEDQVKPLESRWLCEPLLFLLLWNAEMIGCKVHV